MARESAYTGWITWFGFALLALLVPFLLAYDIYYQIRTPVIDFNLDWQSGTVLDVPQETSADYAGLIAGDVILTVNGANFSEWHNMSVKNYDLSVQRQNEVILIELSVVPMAKVNLSRLLSASIVVILFWASCILLLIRQRQLPITRLLYLIGQVSALTILYSLAHPPPWTSPPGPLILSLFSFYWLAPLTLHLYITFPITLGTPYQRRWGLRLIYFLALLAMCTSLWDSSIIRKMGEAYTIMLLTASMTLLSYTYFSRATPEDRRHLRLIFFSTLLAIVPSSIFFFIPGLYSWPYQIPVWMVGLFLLTIPLSYSYAITRHNLFGIDRMLNRAVVYGILSLGILLLYLGPFLLIYHFASSDILAQMMSAAGLTLLVGLAFDWTRAHVQHLVDRLFYGGWYDYPVVIETASDVLARSLERDQVVDVLTRQVPEMMQLHPGQMWIDKTPPGKTEMQRLSFTFQLQGEQQAIWQVGTRRDGEAFSTADQRIITTLAHQAEIALNNALLVEQLRQQLAEIRASRKALTQTQHKLLRSREEERSRLARDLHDGPLQALVGMNLQIGMLLAQTLPKSTAPHEYLNALENMRAEVRVLLGDLRQVCGDLRPPMLDTLGLGAALHSLADDWSTQSGIKVHIDLASDAILRTLPNEIATNLYRVAQETLSNITRHATAQNTTLRLEWNDNALIMTIHDDGQGFSVPKTFHTLTEQGHFGLAGMKERIDLIGGTLNLESTSEAGTIVQIVWQSPSHKEQAP